MQFIPFIAALIVSTTCYAQIYEDFSDGDLNRNPAWLGDEEVFIVEQNRLQLNATNPGDAFLITPNAISAEATWEFDLTMSFNPSSRNFCRIYLMSDSPDLQGPVDGYYVLIGGSMDEISLFRQDQDQHVQIIDSGKGVVDMNEVDITLRAIRNSNFQWDLQVLWRRSQTFILLGSTIDDTYLSTEYFGFFCQFTLSRAQAFSFDNIRITGKQPQDPLPTGGTAMFDVVINEIMADPSPPLQLPEIEYIEVYNRSEQTINLRNWRISDAKKSVRLPERKITPGSYLVLTPITTESFSNMDSHLQLSSWPSLNNDGDSLFLTNSRGKIIHFIGYSNDWYRNNIKKHGGWSLEMIDSNYPCTGKLNWTASTSFLGGTPGSINSVATDNPDRTPPRIQNIFADNSYKIHISFDQALAHTEGSQVNISLSPKLDIDTIYLPNPLLPELIIELKDSLRPETIYDISISDLADCNGNLSMESSLHAKVGIAQPADSGDLIINEILFNPAPLGVRFVELYNRSKKAFNLKNWGLAVFEGETMVDYQLISTENRMIYPQGYLALTESIEKLITQYPTSAEAPILSVQKLPLRDRIKGSVALIGPNEKLIDLLNYHKNMHHRLLVKDEGVSLERANPDISSSDVNNWYSGSESKGYATPGLINSQISIPTSNSSLKIFPEVFSPMSSVFPSYTQISYDVGPGSSGSMMIYNQRGHLIKTLSKNALLPSSGVFQWDGSDDYGHRVPFGYYIVLLQIAGGSDGKNNWKKTVVVAP